MIGAIGTAGMTGTKPVETKADARAKEQARLVKTAQSLEGVFVQQMFKAMRETVPENGLTSGGQGEEMFSGMLDQKMADQMPAQWHHGPADAIVKHFRAQIGGK